MTIDDSPPLAEPATSGTEEHNSDSDDSQEGSDHLSVVSVWIDLEQSAKYGYDEGFDAYCPGGFHPVYIGDIYNERYEVLSKIGYGAYSTVWLVKDLSSSPDDPKSYYRALKIVGAWAQSSEVSLFEREILYHLRDGPKESGYNAICHVLDSFDMDGPNGSHACYVMELMGETLRTFPRHFEREQLPEHIMQRFTVQILQALRYAHRRGVIHTDIKPDNIFIPVRDFSQIESGYLHEYYKFGHHEQDRSSTRYAPLRAIPPRFDYFVDKNTTQFDVVLGDWGVASWKDKRLTDNIQPERCVSPEVLIEAPWDESTDIWNLGAILLDVFRGVRLFPGGNCWPDFTYSELEHITEIVHTFGPWPQSLLKRGNPDVVNQVFDHEGYVFDPPQLDREPLLSDRFLQNLPKESQRLFAGFLTYMMAIDPTDRPSVDELLHHPWLSSRSKLLGKRWRRMARTKQQKGRKRRLQEKQQKVLRKKHRSRLRRLTHA